MRINVGIRRRLAPLVENGRRRVELLNSLLFSLPGTPIVYYGDEIGMGDNIYMGDRNGVRTPMQWTPDRNGGFSRADPARLYAPPIMDPVYGYESVNVEAQSRSLSSQLSATKRLISVRKSTLAFGRGSMTFIRPANRAVLAYVRQHQDEVILCVTNLSRAAQATELDLSPWKDRIPQEMPGRTRFEATQYDIATRYVVPMQIEWVRFDRERFNPKALAAVRQGAREGTLLDVATDQIFIGLFLRNLSQKLVVEENDLRLEFKPTSLFSEYTVKEPERIRAIEQSNSTALVDNQYVAKIYRQLESGINPEIEIGHYLTEVDRFAHAPALLGSVELVEGDMPSALGVLHAYVENQGD